MRQHAARCDQQTRKGMRAIHDDSAVADDDVRPVVTGIERTDGGVIGENRCRHVRGHEQKARDRQPEK